MILPEVTFMEKRQREIIRVVSTNQGGLYYVQKKWRQHKAKGKEK